MVLILYFRSTVPTISSFNKHFEVGEEAEVLENGEYGRCKILDKHDDVRGNTVYFVQSGGHREDYLRDLRALSSNSPQPDTSTAKPKYSKEDDEAQSKKTLRAMMKLRVEETTPNLLNTWKDITDVEAAVCDIIWPLYANWLHERLGPCTRNAKFEWSPSTDEPTSVTIYITCETEPETWKCSIVEEETLNAVPETLRSSIHIVIQRGKPHLSCDPSRSDSVQQKDLVLTIEEI
jgi:hypothetical protein